LTGRFAGPDSKQTHSPQTVLSQQLATRSEKTANGRRCLVRHLLLVESTVKGITETTLLNLEQHNSTGRLRIDIRRRPHIFK